ncbi:hypothetical protein AQUCO_01400168v1, partial [Aquilegia coerulea]
LKLILSSIEQVTTMEVETRVQAIATLSKALDTIPDAFIRPEKEQPALTTFSGPVPEIPTIDFSEQDEEKLIQNIFNASKDWGLFQIVNHGIPVEAIKKLQTVGREFFELPVEEKEVYAKPADAETIEGYGTKLQKEMEGKKTWVDYLFHNVWPPSRINYKFWPKNPPSYRETNEEYVTYLREVVDKLFKYLSLGLGVEENTIKEAVGGDDLEYLLKINYYPPCPRPDLTLGVAPHTDMSSITLLVPNEIPGLQVFKDDHWYDAKYIPNALIIHIGDQIERTQPSLRARSIKIMSTASSTKFPSNKSLATRSRQIYWTVFVNDLVEESQVQGRRKKFLSMEIESLRVQAIAAITKSQDTIPAEFIRSEKEQPGLTTFNGLAPDIPTIDLNNDQGHTDLVRLIANASQEWGIFQIINHGIPIEVIQRLQSVGKEFFELPQEEKEKYANTPDDKSIEGYGTRLQKEIEGKKAWADYLFHNIWPPPSINYKYWPKNPPSYRETNENYAKHLKLVVNKLLMYLSLGLGLEGNAIKDAVGGEELEYLLKINYYPPCPRPDLALGVVQHTDMSAITVLVPNEVQGLQVLKDDQWINAKYIPNALIIHIGDQVEVIIT